ncbi:MAG TPA: ABC transporter permease [Gemmatimonadaceae bacterium]|nr:ABC transporter permease [Gemmatimonadaceae bacterium]
MPELSRDLRLAVRSLARRPAFCVVVILTLALGIGANSAIFSVINAVLLKPLPYREPERLAMIWSRWTNFDKTWLSAAEYLDYRAMDRQFEDVGLWTTTGEVAITGGGDAPESVNAVAMTANLLPVLGMAPLHGRTFTAEEDVPGGPAVAMLGYDLWQRRYGGDASLVGRTIEIDGSPVQVVGILPPAFRFPIEFQSRSVAQVVQPVALNRSAPNRGNHGYYAIARLRPGVEVALVTNELRNLTRRWTEEGLYPESMRFTAFSVPLIEEVSGGVQLALKVLAAAVGLLLLLTCANVANLLLTRADNRSREVAVRAALGADRWNILRLAVTESVLLGMAGGVLGLAFAWAGLRVLVARAPTTIPRLDELAVDAWVAGFALLLSVATGVLLGLVSAGRIGRVDLAGALREGSRGQSGSVARRRGRTLLVVAEMALAVLLVIGAGLTIRSFRNLQAISPGFDARNVLTLRLSLPASRHPTAAHVVSFYEQLGNAVRQLPGVTDAGFVRLLPLASEIGDAFFEIEGRPLPPNEPGRSADWQAATPGYFEAMRTPLVRGRLFGPEDTPDGNQVILINETLAREYFPGEDPVGQRVRFFGQQSPWRTVVGVVGDVHHNGITRPVKRAFFAPHNQWHNSAGGTSRRAMTLAVRATGDPRALLRPIEQAVRRLDPDLPLTQIATLEDVLAAATREQRFTTGVMTGFAGLALVLAAVGIFGVMSYSVSQRTREIGIRLALGAGLGSVRALVIRQGLVPAVAGIALGVGAAALLTQYLRNLLYGVAPIDALTFTTIPVLLLVVAGGSVLIPALRASRVDPVEALRQE